MLCWSGIIRCEMKSALEMRVPQRIPQVSRLDCVFGCARFRKVVRRSDGSIIVRRGTPDSDVAVGLKVYFVCCAGFGGGDGVCNGG